MLPTCPASVIDWFNKDPVMCYHIYMTMHVKDPLLYTIRVRHRVMLAGFWLSLYSLDVLNRNASMIQSINKTCSDQTGTFHVLIIQERYRCTEYVRVL